MQKLGGLQSWVGWGGRAGSSGLCTRAFLHRPEGISVAASYLTLNYAIPSKPLREVLLDPHFMTIFKSVDVCLNTENVLGQQ